MRKKKKFFDDKLNEAFKKFGLLKDDLKSEFDHLVKKDLIKRKIDE